MQIPVWLSPTILCVKAALPLFSFDIQHLRNGSKEGKGTACYVFLIPLRPANGHKKFFWVWNPRLWRDLRCSGCWKLPLGMEPYHATLGLSYPTWRQPHKILYNNVLELNFSSC
jgi:hypothetical protein